MGVGTIVNPFQLVVDRGRQDLFDNGAWLAIHNYVINHPLDYPYDPVNQTGQLLTLEEYEANRWGWDDVPLSVTNRLRKEGAQPGETIRDDATCWLAYSLWNEQVVAAFGHSVPMMSTEGGLVVGDRQDGRYPRNDARRHEEVTLWIQDFLLSGAPTWYFTVFHWLIANRMMGQDRPGWETQCWYTDWWNMEFGLQGRLPTVDALKLAPSRIRHDAIADSVINGHLVGNPSQPPDGRRMKAWTDGKMVRATESREDGYYRFVGLAPGTYAVTVDGVLGAVTYGLTLSSHSTLSQAIRLPGAQSAIGGRVTDSAGAPRSMQTVVLSQDGQQIASAVTDWQGNYVFGVLAAGTYIVEVPGVPVQTAGLDGDYPVTVNFVVPVDLNYEFKLITRRLLPQSESQGRHVFFGYVRDEAGGPADGVRIEMGWTGAEHGTVFPSTLTGSDAGKPRGYFEFIHTRGEFQLHLRDVPWPAQAADGLKTTGLPGQLAHQSVSYEIVWQLERSGVVPSRSTVTGTIIGGAEGLNVTLRAVKIVVSAPLLADGSFRFDNILAGMYELEVAGAGVVARDIAVDGVSAVNLLPIDITPARSGVIQGIISDLAGNPRVDVQVVLLFQEAAIAQVTTDAEGRYRFEKLLAGTYVVETVYPPARSSGLAVTADRPITVNLRIADPVVGPRPVRHYLLFGPLDAPGTKSNFRVARKYIVGNGAAAGFDPGEASYAERVTIIGDVDAVSLETEEGLRQAGCEVGRIAGDTYAIADDLARLLARQENA
jgi:hypothetical protein